MGWPRHVEVSVPHLREPSPQLPGRRGVRGRDGGGPVPRLHPPLVARGGVQKEAVRISREFLCRTRGNCRINTRV